MEVPRQLRHSLFNIKPIGFVIVYHYPLLPFNYNIEILLEIIESNLAHSNGSQFQITFLIKCFNIETIWLCIHGKDAGHFIVFVLSVQINSVDSVV